MGQPAGLVRDKRINHIIAFSDDGACTDQAESCFSRPRRAEFGQHHHISGVYLGCYAGEARGHAPRGQRHPVRADDG